MDLHFKMTSFGSAINSNFFGEKFISSFCLKNFPFSQILSKPPLKGWIRGLSCGHRAHQLPTFATATYDDRIFQKGLIFTPITDLGLNYLDENQIPQKAENLFGSLGFSKGETYLFVFQSPRTTIGWSGGILKRSPRLR